MGTYGVQIKKILPWLVRLARRAGTIDFHFAFAALVSPVHNNFFLTSQFFNFMCPNHPATGAGSRAGSPVS
jgi:hypothetical protein